MGRSRRHAQVDPVIKSKERVIAGFLCAPIFGLILYFAIPFVIAIPGFSFSHAFAVAVAATLIGGKVFYTPALLVAVVVMLLIRRFYQWNLISSIVGGMIIGLLVPLLFAIGLWITTSDFMLAQVGFFRLFSFFAGPSFLSGIVFWLIAVHRNYDRPPHQVHSSYLRIHS